MPARMTPDDQETHALESLRMVIDRPGWTEADMREYAAQCLCGEGVPISEARGVVAKVWDDRFKIWGPI